MKLIGQFKKEQDAMKDLSSLFRAYFQNKMMILLLMIEHPVISRSALAVEKQKMFLHDLYHHFLPLGTPPKYHRVFRWLNLFLDRYPDVSPRRTYRAIEMVGLVYEAFGMKLHERMEAVRIERESLGLKKSEERNHV